MGALRNTRHEHFVREYIRTGFNGAEAYRRISARFPTRPLKNPDGARVIAHHIRKRPEVRRREQELKRIMAKKADITLDKLLTDIEEAIGMAKAQAKPNDLVNAAMAQGKLVGLLKDRTEIGAPGDFDGVDNIGEILEKIEAEKGAEFALMIGKAFGYVKTEDAPKAEDAALAKAIPPTESVN